MDTWLHWIGDEMDENKIEQLVMWGSAMSASVIERGFMPMVLIGARLTEDDDYELSLASAPGVGRQEVIAALREMLATVESRAYTVRAIDWQIKE